MEIIENKSRSVAVALLAFVFTCVIAACACVMTPQAAHAASIPELASEADSTDVAVVLLAEVNSNDTRDQAFALIKQYREEAYDQGIVTQEELNGMSREEYTTGFNWDSQLEMIAVQRAIECSVLFSHTRPNGQSCFTASTATHMASGEIIATPSSVTWGIMLFYGEKEDYLKYKAGEPCGEYGHYLALISPSVKSYGFGAVSTGGMFSGTGSGVAGETGSELGDGKTLGYDGAYEAVVRIPAYDIDLDLVLDEGNIAPGGSTQASVIAGFQLDPGWGGDFITSVLPESMDFSSSNPAVATIDKDGTVHGVSLGVTRITTVFGESSGSLDLRVSNSKTMHRLYNPNSGEHFYTDSAAERDATIKAGWDYEGEAWYAPQSSSTPVYRLYSGTDHHYTTSAVERDFLKSAGWTDEGISWYSDDAEGVPLYRQFNPNVDPAASFNNSGSHNYTTSKDENDNLVAQGWQEEGIGWYGEL